MKVTAVAQPPGSSVFPSIYIVIGTSCTVASVNSTEYFTFVRMVRNPAYVCRYDPAGKAFIGYHEADNFYTVEGGIYSFYDQ